MVEYRIEPGGQLGGDVRVPGDKSISHRGLILGAIADGVTTIHGLLESTDIGATCHALEQLGVRIDRGSDNAVRVHGAGLYGLRAAPRALDLGNSGTGVRLLIGLLAAQKFESVFTGDDSLSRRPMRRLVDPLCRMGAAVATSEEGTLPVTITPVEELQGAVHELSVASAQVKSALLLAGLYARGITTVVEPVATRDHTERLLGGFGYPVVKGQLRVSIDGGGCLRGVEFTVPKDLSSAAFFIVGASIATGSRVTLRGLGVNPTRTGVIKVLRDMGGSISIDNQRMVAGEPIADVSVASAPLRGVTIGGADVALAIDEIPALAIAAACASGTTVVTGAEELRVKESDRIRATVTGLQGLGVTAEEKSDGMVIQGGRLEGGSVESFGDHRIAMAFAIAGLAARDRIHVRDCEHVSTSFPYFERIAADAGLRITATS